MITKVELHIYNLGTLPDVHWWLHLCKANRALKLIPNTANGDGDGEQSVSQSTWDPLGRV